MRRLTLSVLSVAVLAACQPGVAPLTDEDIEVLNDMRTAHVQATLAGDCDASYAMFAEDVVYLVPNDATVEGRAAMRALCEPVQDFTVDSHGIDGNADLAFDRGTWSRTSMSEGVDEATTISGKYVMIARKQADGSWLWTVGIVNLDVPEPQPEQP